MELEHALELLEPLLFILSRLLKDICRSLASHALAANELELVLDLEKNREYTRTLCLPFATRDAQTFLKLLQYDLSAHPPEAANRRSPFDGRLRSIRESCKAVFLFRSRLSRRNWN